MMDLKDRGIEEELHFFTSRSSGPGGQNVNKVNTRVELRFKINESSKLNEEEKNQLLNQLRNRITNSGELVIVSQEERSQLKNKKNVVDRFYALVLAALAPRKKRKKTSPTRSSVEDRLRLKKIASQKKELRKRDPDRF